MDLIKLKENPHQDSPNAISKRVRAWEIEIHSSVGLVRDISRAKRGKFFQFTALLIEKFMKSRAKMHGIKLSLKVRFQFTKHFQY